jgi:hypothetical protein
LIPILPNQLIKKFSPCLRKKQYAFLLLLFFLGIHFNSHSQCIPSFGKSSHFTLFTITGAVGNTGISNINGDLGTNIGAITNFEAPTNVSGTIHYPGTFTAEASVDLIYAYNQLSAIPATNIAHTAAFGSG